jgi:hypothetical protein
MLSINCESVQSTLSNTTLGWLVNFNEGKSAASLSHQMAPWVSDMFSNFFIAKNHKIANNSTSTKPRGLESLEF